MTDFRQLQKDVSQLRDSHERHSREMSQQMKTLQKLLEKQVEVQTQQQSIMRDVTRQSDRMEKQEERLRQVELNSTTNKNRVDTAEWAWRLLVASVLGIAFWYLRNGT